MKHTIACVISLFLSLTLNAQEPLNNETILKLVKAGIGEDVIVSMVNQQPGKYSLSTDDIIALPQPPLQLSQVITAQDLLLHLRPPRNKGISIQHADQFESHSSGSADRCGSLLYEWGY